MNNARYISLLVLSIICMRPEAVQCAKKLVFRLEPEIGYGAGSAQYELDLHEADTGVVRGVRSLLKFPLNVFQVGARIHAESRLSPTHRIGATAGFLINLNNPSGKMEDDDWFHIQGGTDVHFSSTKSKAKLNNTVLTLDGHYGFRTGQRTWLDLVWGYRYQRIVEDITGYSGWQLLGGMYPVSGDEHALYYRVIFHSASVGLRMGGDEERSVAAHVDVRFTPTYMSDYDDHLLRYKVSTASGWGVGGRSSVGIRCLLKPRRPKSPYLDISADFMLMSGSMSQTQRWYADDPASAEDDTGVTLSGIPHSIKSTQYGIRAIFGIPL